MASHSKKTKARRRRRHRHAGRERKNRQARQSTPSEEVLFAGCGEPGKPAPKTQSL